MPQDYEEEQRKRNVKALADAIDRHIVDEILREHGVEPVAQQAARAEEPMNREHENLEGMSISEKEATMAEAVRLAKEKGLNGPKARFLEDAPETLSPHDYLAGQIHGRMKKKVDETIKLTRQRLNITEKEMLRAFWLEVAHVVTLPETEVSRKTGIDQPRQLVAGPEKDKQIVYTLPCIREALLVLLGAERVPAPETKEPQT